jgi:hypothetical protein
MPAGALPSVSECPWLAALTEPPRASADGDSFGVSHPAHPAPTSGGSAKETRARASRHLMRNTQKRAQEPVPQNTPKKRSANW